LEDSSEEEARALQFVSSILSFFYPPLGFFENKLIILRQMNKEFKESGDAEFHVVLGTKEKMNK